jgi:phage N-6-adenine-methyltransferase
MTGLYMPLAKRDDWETPAALFSELDAEFGFTLDAAASATNAKCPCFYDRSDDGLQQDWSGEVVWLNPPFGAAVLDWVRKAYESSLAGATVVCLVAARTDTAWFHDYALRGEIRFLRGRLTFVGADRPAPFLCMLVIFRPRVRA